MPPLIIALIILLGAGGTVAASDFAVPGDLLFSIDRSVENIRLAFSSDEKKSELKIKFAEERVEEFKVVVKKYSEKHFSDDSDDSNSSTTDSSDKTLDKSSERMAQTLETALDFLSSVSFGPATSTSDKEERLLVLLDELNSELGNLPDGLKGRLQIRDGDSKLKIKFDGGKTRIELKDEDGKIKLEMEDGEVKFMKKEEEDHDDDDGDDHEDSDDDSKSSSHSDDDKDEGDDDSFSSTSTDDTANHSRGLTEVEAKIFTNETIVKVEINDVSYVFSTDATTRDTIVADILKQFDLTREVVEATLVIKTEDCASRADDSREGR